MTNVNQGFSDSMSNVNQSFQDSLSQQVRVVPTRNTPIRVHPSITLQPKITTRMCPLHVLEIPKISRTLISDKDSIPTFQFIINNQSFFFTPKFTEVRRFGINGFMLSYTAIDTRGFYNYPSVAQPTFAFARHFGGSAWLS
jgi:hypothetical protein